MKTEHVATARELLEILSPLHSNPISQTGVLFRSQFEENEAGYPILPSLLRDIYPNTLAEKYHTESDTFLKSVPKGNRYNDLYDYPILQEAMARSYMEQKILKDFVWRANLLGIDIPGSDFMLNKELIHGDFVNGSNLYKLGLKETEDHVYALPADANQRYIENLKRAGFPPLYTGLAQHHGAVTRLVDVSYSAYKSLFHVTNNGRAQTAFKERKDGFIAIYWFNDSPFQTSLLLERARTQPEDHTLMTSTYQLVRMPSNSNHYLHHQEGLFAYASFPYDHKLLHGKYPSLNDFLSAYYPGYEALNRIIVPISELDNLKSLLSEFSITKSQMMPTLDNVVEDMSNFKLR